MTEITLPTDKMLARVEDGIGWMVYNNPQRLNAMSLAMQQSVPIILEAFEADPEVRVVIVSGAGGRAFVSGADISEFGEKRTSPEARAVYDEAAAASGRAWAAVDKPILAMIDGYCIGGGMLTALSTDIRICSEPSQFGVPAARLGLGYGYGGVERLQAVVGPSWTAEILFSARRLSSAEALQIGLVNRVVSREELEPTVRALAAQIAENAPLTIRATKAALRETMKDPAKRDMERVATMVEACFRSEDYLEGQQAFMEKRTPNFRGV
jgi:enoyl-CoA hydratase/carnithine racemase